MALVADVSLGDCAPPISIQELYEQWYEAGNGDWIAARYRRLTNNNSATNNLSCAIEVYVEDEGYVNRKEFATYEVVQVYNVNNVTNVGDSIPLVWDTDTGARQDLPTRLLVADEFLAFGLPLDRCADGQPFIPPHPIFISECDALGNIAWVDVAPEDKAFLLSKISTNTTTTVDPEVSQTSATSAAVPLSQNRVIALWVIAGGFLIGVLY